MRNHAVTVPLVHEDTEGKSGGEYWEREEVVAKCESRDVEEI